MVSGQVLADESGHLQHVETRHGEDRLQRAVGLDDAALSYCTIINQADQYSVLYKISITKKETRHTIGRCSKTQ